MSFNLFCKILQIGAPRGAGKFQKKVIAEREEVDQIQEKI